MAQSKELAEKSVHAAVAAIEVYNKPDFHFREEAFALLMTNAWELLLKAKWLLDHSENIASLYEYDRNPDGTTTPRIGRSGNPITLGLGYLAVKLSKYPEQVQRLMDYLDSLQKDQGDEKANTGPQHFALRLETRLARAKEDAVMSFRITDDPKAPEVALREEDVLKTYSLTYNDLTKAMKRRYEDFLSNEKYHSLRRPSKAIRSFACCGR